MEGRPVESRELEPLHPYVTHDTWVGIPTDGQWYTDPATLPWIKKSGFTEMWGTGFVTMYRMLQESHFEVSAHQTGF